MEVKLLSPFDYVTGINSKNYVYEEGARGYSQYVTNLAFSYFPDTVLITNEANIMSSTISDKQHFDFLYNIIRRGKRYSKWHKKDDMEILNLISDVYNVSREKAKEIRSLLSDEKIAELKYLKGGKDV